MAEGYELAERGEEIVLYFDISSEGLDAQTFGRALITFDEVYRAISEVINPGADIEIEFIRSDHGSIRAVLKSIKKDTKSLLQSPFLYIIFPFLLGLLTNSLTSNDVKIVINDSSYVVIHGSEKIVLPRSLEAKAKQVERDPSVRRSVRNFFSVVEADPNVKAVDFRSAQRPNSPVIPIDRGDFAKLRELPDLVPPELPKYKTETYRRQTVVVVTAVLEKARSKWRFPWNGQRIAADIRDDTFFEKMAQHEYEFGQGDTLVVDLVAEQELNEIVKAYETKKYHVTKVHSHNKGPKQTIML